MSMIEIPTYSDDPPQFLMFYIDELVAVALCFVAGIMTNHLTYGLIASYFVTKLYSKFREGHQVNYLQHILYWKGVYPINSITVPIALVKVFR